MFMKRSLQLSLAIALALGGMDAHALGLGPIQVKSGLNQPLEAEIPVIQSAPGEAEGLIVQLAAAEDFDRVGLSRSRLNQPLEFSLGKNARGEAVIRVTTKDIVREPFLDFLVEANWPKGRLLREYTLLLDPPVMAPALKGSSAIATAAAEPERAQTETLPSSRPAAAPTPAKPAAKPAPAPAPERVAVAKPATAPHVATGGEYGPVAAGETLSEIARATRPDEVVSVNQMMLALLRHNPNAFYRGNINALKRGAILRIPSGDEVKSTASAREAAETVRAQIDEWRGGAVAAPTLLADTSPSAPARGGSAKGKDKAAGAAFDERLALVPPRAGKDGQGVDDRPGGTGNGGGSASAETRAELARVKEALAAREQESGDLKSRVRELEDLKGKNDRLISLQNSQIKELQDKLKALQAEATKPAATGTAAAVGKLVTEPALAAGAAKPANSAGEPKLSKDDIWGDSGVTPVPKPSETIVATPAPVAEATAPAVANGSDVAKPATDAAPDTMPSEPVHSEPAPNEIAKPDAGTPAVAVPTPAKPAESAPAKPVAKPAAKPEAAASAPWYMEPWVLGGAGVIGLLLALFGITRLRKPKPVAAPRATASVAGAFAPTTEAPAAGHVHPDEAGLLDRIEADPYDIGARLELASVYYAERDVPRFEATAEAMHGYVTDVHQAEWQQVRLMGAELAPYNPLFADPVEADPFAGDDASAAPLDPFGETSYAAEPIAATAERSAYDTAAMPVADFGHDFGFDPAPAAVPAEEPAPAPARADLPGFEFDNALFGTPAASKAKDDFGFADLPPLESQPASTPAHGFGFDDLPPLEPQPAGTPAHSFDFDDAPSAQPAAIVETPASAPASATDGLFIGDDAIGTKLDLARAYLDMGDPDGARSMLEEVLTEGNESQQGEARRLLAEMR